MPLLVRSLCLGAVETNCYVVGCSQARQGFVIDPADDGERILRVVDELGLSILAVLVTHAHFDHIMAAADVVAATDAPLVLHPNDLALFRNGGGAALFGVRPPVLPEPGRLLSEGERLTFGSHELQVLLTPGHSPGHVSYYDAGAGVVFSGDVLFAGGIGRTDIPGGDQETLLASIRGTLGALPPTTRVFPGHGPPTTVGEELASNPWLG
jgi:hydroxyacylglutathione hydrolase